MSSMDPFMLIYTSGTTGRPKGTVHYHAGFPLKAAQDLAHLFDLRAGEVLFWFTDMGWMMGPWAILGGLALGATLILYQGAPDYPSPDRLWALVARHRVTHLGLSPTLVRALVPFGTEPVRKHDLSTLRELGSTGEPWNPEPYLWLFHEVGRGRCPIINYSGGTEVSGGLLGCVTHRPIKPAGFNTAVPGIQARVLDDSGRPVKNAVGDLAVVAPSPGFDHSDKLAEEIREKVAEQLGKPLKPQSVQFVSDLPKTRNAKVMRRLIRATYLGEPAGDTSALENPQALEAIRAARNSG